MIEEPDTAEELHAVLAERPHAVLVGGCTALRLDELGGSPELVTVRRLPGATSCGPGWIGAACTLEEIAAHRELPTALRDAAASIGTPAVRAWATVGGNLALPGCLAVAVTALRSVADRVGPYVIGAPAAVEDAQRPLLGVRLLESPAVRTAFIKRVVHRGGRRRVAAAAAAWRPADRTLSVAVGGRGEQLRATKLVDGVGAGQRAAAWCRTRDAVTDEYAEIVTRVLAATVARVVT